MNYVIEAFSNLERFLAKPETLHIFVNNRFLVILLVIVLIKAKYKTYSSLCLSALVNIPGTFLHEMSHFIVGLLFNARPTRFNLWPKKRDSGYVLGSVSLTNPQFYNALPASLAPLLLLIIGYYFNKWYFANVKIGYLNYIGYIFLQTVIIENAIPSAQDFRIAFSRPLGVVLYFVLILAGLLYFL